MFSVLPIVRHMLLCEDVQVNKANPRKLNLLGFTSTVRSLNEERAARIVSLCVFLQLTELFRPGSGEIIVREEETDQKIYSSFSNLIQPAASPLHLVPILFRIGPIDFPRPGLYSFLFCYNEVELAHELLTVR